MDKSSRTQDLFLKAIRLPDGEREAFLNRECAGDSRLLRNIRDLLRHHFSKTILPRSADTVQTAPKPSSLSRLFRSLKTREVSRQFNYERRRLIIVALLLTLLLAATSTIVRRKVHERIAFEMGIGLGVIADRQMHGVRYWLQAEERLARTWASRSEVVNAVWQLEMLHKGGPIPAESIPARESGAEPTPEQQRQIEERSSALHDQILASMKTLACRPPNNSTENELRFAIWNQDGHLIGDSHARDLIGNGVTDYGATILFRVLKGETTVWLPTRKGFITSGFNLPDQLVRPELAILTPVHDAKGKVLAAVLLSGLGLQERFDNMLGAISFGETGETYAFDSEGFLVSKTRFFPEFVELGLLSEDRRHAYWDVRVTNPGVDVTTGERSDTPRDEWPLTQMAAAATAGRSGEDTSGYPDYRGKPVIGVWRWIPEYGFGIAAEVDVDNAYVAINYIWWGFMGLLAATLVVPIVIVWTAVNSILKQRELPGKLGMYELGERIGEGGVGQVYRAVHAMLKRPTAIKVLKGDQVTETARNRFEREVRLAAQLDHPNTIEIYDYGEDDAGRLYYAMEYIDGLTLSQLILKIGSLPAERVVHLLRQVCLSLREAHSRGLVHRDIKPHNIMVCCRGGEADIVKVLDFGLVKQFALDYALSLTNSGVLVGTPMYIPPERLRDPTVNDPRSDLYSLGIVAFEMLTGQAPFLETDPAAIMHDTMFTAPREMKLLMRGSVPAELVQLVNACLSKSVDHRPASASDMLERLDRIPLADIWTQHRACLWWRKYGTTSQVSSLPKPTDSQIESLNRMPAEVPAHAS